MSTAEGPRLAGGWWLGPSVLENLDYNIDSSSDIVIINWEWRSPLKISSKMIPKWEKSKRPKKYHDNCAQSRFVYLYTIFSIYCLLFFLVGREKELLRRKFFKQKKKKTRRRRRRHGRRAKASQAKGVAGGGRDLVPTI